MARFGNALDKGLDILESLESSQEPLSFSALRNSISIPQASFARYLKVLAGRGYVRQVNGGGYVLGWRAVQLGLAGLSRSPLPGAAKPHLEMIMNSTKESAELAVFEGSDFIFLERVESPRSVVLKARAGSRFGITDNTAIGALALSLGWQSKNTDLKSQDKKKILNENFAWKLQNNNEVYRGAAPLFNHTGACIGSIGIAAPAFRVKNKEKTLFKKLLKKEAEKISVKLGYLKKSNQ